MPAITPDLLEHARGCLLGAAVGDAFGMSLEGLPRQDVKHQVRELRRGRSPLGQFSEITGAALTVGERLLDGIAPGDEDLARQLTAGRKRASQGVRPGLLRRLAGGERGREPRGEPGEEADASVLARCLPVALANVADRNACLAQARDLVVLTHRHPDCSAGGAFVAAVLWNLLHGMAIRQAVQQSLHVCGAMPEALAEKISMAPTRTREQLSNGPLVGSVLESVIWGLVTTASFAEAITRVTNLGGSATNAGALIGAFAGAAYHHGGIPADWRAQTYGTWPPRGGRTWLEADLVELANRLVLARKGA